MSFLDLLIIAVVILGGIALMNRLLQPRVVPISNPVLGTLNLIGISAEEDLKNDLQQLTQYFGEVRQADDVAPMCDVLLLYCHISDSGAVIGSVKTLGEIIRDAGALVAVVASNNDVESYKACAPTVPIAHANLVMTLERDGSLLASFLAKMFAQMKQGISMPIAWNSLAPQYPTAKHKDVPATLCFLDAGQVVFD